MIFGAAAPRAQESLLTPDYDRLFAENADAVAQETAEDGTRVEKLVLPGPVEITRQSSPDGTGNVLAIDQSGLGAVGCALRIQIGLARLVRHCEAFGTEQTDANLRDLRAPILEFYARNNVPQRPVEDLEAQVEALIDGSRATLTPQRCETAITDDVQLMLDLMVLPGMNQEIAEVLSQPRLPVTNPCL